MRWILSGLKVLLLIAVFGALAVVIPWVSLWGYSVGRADETASAKATEILTAHPLMCISFGGFAALLVIYATRSGMRAMQHIRKLRRTEGSMAESLLLFHFAEGLLLTHALSPLNTRVTSQLLSGIIETEGTPLWQGYLLGTSGLDSFLTAAALINFWAASCLGMAKIKTLANPPGQPT